MFKGPWITLNVDPDANTIIAHTGTPLVKTVFDTWAEANPRVVAAVCAKNDQATQGMLDALKRAILVEIRDQVLATAPEERITETLIQKMELPPGGTMTLVLPHRAHDVPFFSAFTLVNMAILDAVAATATAGKPTSKPN